MNEMSFVFEKVAGNVNRICINHGLRPNIAIQTGQDGVLLVDTGYIAVIDILKAEIKKLSNKPIKYIINSHPHGDHISGLKSFSDEIAKINFKNFEQFTTKVIPTCIHCDSYKTTCFDEFNMLNFNNEDILLIPSPGTHTHADMLIYFTKSDVVHTGDLLITQSFPAIQFNIPQYLIILDKIINTFTKNTKYIGGHGRVFTRQEVVEYRKMLKDTINIIIPQIKKGLTLEQIINKNLLKKYEQWGEFIKFLNKDSWTCYIYRSYSRIV